MNYLVRRSLVVCLAGLYIILFSGGCAKKAPIVVERPVDEVSDRYVRSADEMAKDGQYKTSNFFYKKAITNYEKLKIWDKAIKCYIKVGDNYRKLEDVKTALGTLNRALDLTENHLGYQHLELAKSFQKLAFKYFRGGNLEKALELYQKALAIQLDVLGKDHPDVAKTYNSIALVYLNKNQLVDANKSYLKSLSIKVRQLNINNDDEPRDIKEKYLLLEKVREGGETDKEALRKARERFDRSIAEYRKLYGQNKPLFADIYEHIGILHAFEGNFDRALEYLRKALDIRLDIFGDLSLEAGTSYLDIGICLRLQEDHEDALNFLNTALSIKSERLGEFHPDTADIYCQIGKAYYQQDQLDEALGYFQKSLIALVPGFEDNRISSNPSLDTVTPKDKLLDILSAKANVLRVKYIRYPENLETLRWAYSAYSLLSRLVEIMRQDYKSESYKLFFGEKNHTIYQQAIQVALLLYEMTEESKYREAAFVLSEKSKAAVLEEALSEANAKQFAGIPFALLEKEKNLKEELTHYDTYLQKEYHREKIDERKIKNLEERYFSLMLEYRQLIGNFESSYKKYYDLKYKPPVVDLREIRKSLDPETALIEYFIGEYVVHIYVLTDRGLEVVDLPLDEDLTQLVGTYNRSIKKIEERPFLELSRKLYRVLLEPVHHLVEKKKKLIIIPDGPLYTLPFESLTGGATSSNRLSDQDFMVKHFAFSYHYSANLWLYSVNKRRAKKDNEVAFIGFAPVFGEKTQNGDGYVLIHDPARVKKGQSTGIAILRDSDGDAGPVVSQLPATEEEVYSIIRLFKSRQKKAAGYFHRKATEGNFKTVDMQGYDLIHIATHSLKDEGQYKLSGLIFSQPADKRTDKEDGILYSGEIYNLNLGAELIVLSSCESGVGKLLKGEGMMALNRGFFYSGIRNIVFSLWKVEDRSTSKLMIAFYRNILDGLPYCRALQNAKLELINDRFTAFPKYWSGFVLVGK